MNGLSVQRLLWHVLRGNYYVNVVKYENMQRIVNDCTSLLRHKS